MNIIKNNNNKILFELYNSIISSYSENSLDEIENHIKNGNINYESIKKYGENPLSILLGYHIFDRNVELFKLFIKEKEIFVDCPNFYGRTPLMVACFINEKSSNLVVDILIKNGSNILKKDRFGNCSLIYSVMNKNVYNNNNLFLKLIHYGANINSMNKKGFTFLYYFLKNWANFKTPKEMLSYIKIFVKKGLNICSIFDNSYNYNIIRGFVNDENDEELLNIFNCYFIVKKLYIFENIYLLNLVFKFLI